LGYAAVTAFILIVSLMGVACGDTTTTYTEYVYRADQSVSGNGFYSSHQNIVSGNLHLSNFGCGSGKYNHETKLAALNQANNDTTGQYFSTSERSILFNETTDQVYGASNLNLGSSSFKSGPLSVLGKEATCIKNYENGTSGISMDALFDSASVLSKDLSANLYWKSITSGYINDPNEDYSVEQKGVTGLKVDATFTGEGHIGASETNNSTRGWDRRPTLLVDEDYLGTFSLSKKMSSEFTFKWTQTGEDWLPCCYGGWDDMRPADKKGFGVSTKGIFDCTCYKAPSIAQFTEPEETKAW
jgi:hypothetical protein